MAEWSWYTGCPQLFFWHNSSRTWETDGQTETEWDGQRQKESERQAETENDQETDSEFETQKVRVSWVFKSFQSLGFSGLWVFWGFRGYGCFQVFGCFQGCGCFEVFWVVDVLGFSKLWMFWGFQGGGCFQVFRIVMFSGFQSCGCFWVFRLMGVFGFGGFQGCRCFWVFRVVLLPAVQVWSLLPSGSWRSGSWGSAPCLAAGHTASLLHVCPSSDNRRRCSHGQQFRLQPHRRGSPAHPDPAPPQPLQVQSCKFLQETEKAANQSDHHKSARKNHSQTIINQSEQTQW